MVITRSSMTKQVSKGKKKKKNIRKGKKINDNI